jgi:hypothetical protein
VDKYNPVVPNFQEGQLGEKKKKIKKIRRFSLRYIPLYAIILFVVSWGRTLREILTSAVQVFLCLMCFHGGRLFSFMLSFPEEV